ncbi:elongation factor 1-alpha [Artemisia annua]|uniref:Elongation factor 1-alpha n=1 Tax=Artemisia annua TaxID=35608 RepID=A0A2U1NL00_ARTAN|nr:elongation factor 1-alpha [Artemisia annua]
MLNLLDVIIDNAESKQTPVESGVSVTEETPGQEYELEGIHWKKVDVEDNEECLDLIQKMHIITSKYSKSMYYDIEKRMYAYLSKIGYKSEEIPFDPVTGYDGDNLIEKSTNLGWYNRPTLLEALQELNNIIF